jgi:hypothetical protein
MGILYKTVYHRHRPIFRGDRRNGLLVFDPLPEENDELRIVIDDFVLAFDASDSPREVLDVDFRFGIQQGVVEFAPEKGN